MAMVDHREFGLGLEAIEGWSGILGHVAATVAHSVVQEAGELDRDALIERLACLMTAELRTSLNEMTTTTREVH